MGKKYYCDFCQCSFPDNLTNRQKHNEGAAHQAQRKLHYDWFKDPNEFIAEQLNKPPCRRYISQGYCEYELACRFSHITFDMTGAPIYPRELNLWLQEQERAAQIPPKDKKPTAPKYKLPAGWKVRDLPPSLKPPPKQGYEWVNTGFWG